MTTVDHTVSIGILTYRRAEGVRTCVHSVLKRLESPLPTPWTVREILVIDNDPAGSARDVVAGIKTPTPVMPIRYVNEPTPGVAAARARALRETTSQVLVFIDDDEVAEDGWPHGLLALMHETGAALVGGPVLSEFVQPPPDWIVDGGFFDREDPPHGSSQDWLRSGNLAIDVRQVAAVGITFDPRFEQGEDSAFSRRVKAAGLDLRWSANGAITEFVEPSRFEVEWRLRREFLSHRAWTRSSLDLSTGPIGRAKTRVRVLATAGARMVTGVRHLLRAVLSRNKADAVMGAVDIVGVGAKLVETISYRRAEP